jgi:hypothetical protein
MRKLFVFVVILLGIIFFGSLSVAFGEMMSSTAGVANGDIFRYGYTCYFNSNDTAAAPPASFSAINQTNYLMINVTGVSGSLVNFNTMMVSSNGSSFLGAGSMNVGTGMASISGYGGPNETNNFYFMARNVGIMGKMFPSTTGSPTINGTMMMPYAGGSRLTNNYSTIAAQDGKIVTTDFYFDQATGMMVEWRQQTIQTNGSFQNNSTQLMKMTSSSVWVVPEFSATSIILIFIILMFVTGLTAIVAVKSKILRSTIFAIH